jgi:hypothetical protein
MTFARIRTTVTTVAALTAFASPVLAQQGVQYTTRTKIEMKGALGTMMKFAAKLGGGSTDQTQVTSLQGAHMRTDDSDQKSSQIVDLQNGRFISIDHGKKTYTVMTVAQLTQAMDSLGRAMNAASQQQAAAGTQGDAGKADVQFDMKVEPTGEKKTISGATATRTFITITTDVRYTPEGETEEQQAGRIVMFVDQWNSKDSPAWKAMERFRDEAPAMFDRNANAGGAALAANPGMVQAMAKAAEESRKIEGMAVQSRTWMVLLAPDAPFDRELVLNPKPEPKGESVTDALKKGALGGLLGGKKKEEPKEEPAEDQKQATLLVFTEELLDMKNADLPASLFEPPAGYREVPFTAFGAR